MCWPLTFADPADDERVRADDVVDVIGVDDLAPGSTLRVVLHHGDGTTGEILVRRTMSEDSALNLPEPRS